MKKIALIAVIVAIAGAAAYAGGLEAPVMETEVMVEEAGSFGGGLLLPLLLLLLVAAAVAAG